MPEDLTERVLTLLITTDLRTDGGTQPRGRLDDAVVEHYAEAMLAGLWDFARSSTPITAFFDGQSYWLADGFHRVAAAKKARHDEVKVDVRQGGERDAKWFSFGVNAEHGHARNKDDVARTLKAIFEDAEWRAIPLREIARHTRIPFETVRRHHETIAASDPLGRMDKPVTRTVTRGSTTYTMDVGAIGRSKSPILAAAPAVQLEVGAAETEQAGVGDVTARGETQTARHAEYDSEMQQTLKFYLTRDNFSSVVRHPARQVAAAARTFTPKTWTKVRQRMERHRRARHHATHDRSTCMRPRVGCPQIGNVIRQALSRGCSGPRAARGPSSYRRRAGIGAPPPRAVVSPGSALRT